MHKSYPFNTFSTEALAPPSLPKGPLRKATRTLTALGLLTATAPASAALTGLALLRHRNGSEPPPHKTQQTVLINTSRMTKGLVLMRAFHRAGHRVIVADVSRYRFGGHRYSNAVDCFYVVPDGVRDPNAYIQALLDIIKAEGVDLFVPVNAPAMAQVDADAKERLTSACRVLHFDGELNAILDDKMRFAHAARALGLSAPETHILKSTTELREFSFESDKRYLIKPVVYDSIGRQDKRLLPFAPLEAMQDWIHSCPIDSKTPWVLQEYIQGDEYCAHATVVGGQMMAYVCTESSPYQLNYEPIEHDAIRKWVDRFIAGMKIEDGQLCFDFIVDQKGVPYAIECNPRLHSAITTFSPSAGALGAAYLGEASPHASPEPVYWTAMELERLAKVRNLKQFKAWFHHMRSGRDAVFDWQDPMPFFALHHLQFPSLLVRNLLKGKGFTHIDWCIGKLVEAQGD